MQELITPKEKKKKRERDKKKKAERERGRESQEKEQVLGHDPVVGWCPEFYGLNILSGAQM